ncbi:MAG: DoxX family protein [Terriglobia bacterium]|nr:MAG: DoxX family protein [Terriglobia bacterium]
MADTTVAVPDKRQRRRNTIAWVLSVLLALEFLFAGGIKLAANAMVIAMFQTVGLGLWFMYFTGVLEVIGAIALLVPRFGRLGALLLSLVMLGAIFFQLTKIHNGVGIPIITLLLLLITARLRRVTPA